jgi:hypothetical protein
VSQRFSEFSEHQYLRELVESPKGVDLAHAHPHARGVAHEIAIVEPLVRDVIPLRQAPPQRQRMPEALFHAYASKASKASKVRTCAMPHRRALLFQLEQTRASSRLVRSPSPATCLHRASVSQRASVSESLSE